MKIQIALPIAIVVSLIAIIPPPRIVLDLLLSANISLFVVILLVSYPTNGQRVPEDLLIPSAGEPARHVLNLEPAI
jgi:flagellar biosynthesis component FlhA